MRLAWLTDIHLNYLDGNVIGDGVSDRWRDIDRFLESVKTADVDAVLISGDIGEAPLLTEYLPRMADIVSRPIYFVLGNHDFYHGSIAGVRSAMKSLAQKRGELIYLGESSAIEIAPNVGLLGGDSWADGRYGDFESSRIYLNDFKYIEEFREAGWGGWRLEMQRWADEGAERIRDLLPIAFNRWREIILITHVPPFVEACAYSGRLPRGEWLPFYSCKSMGDVLLEVMSRRPDCTLRVFAGHTHSVAEVAVLNNLVVSVGAAEYRNPAIQRVISVA